MARYVFAVMYGSAEIGNSEVMFRLYHNHSDACQYAADCMNEAWVEDAEYSHETTTDEQGNTINKIMRNSIEVEWWRVVGTKVY